jgi:uncharacterized phage-associated protein
MNHDDLSATRQANPDDLVTVGNKTSTVSSLGDPAWKEIMPTSDLLPRATEHRHPTATDRRYRAPMATADTVATLLREQLRDRITYLTDRKIQALLYLAQMSQLAAADRALFGNAIAATADGVAVAGLTGQTGEATDAEFSTAVFVAARYGGLATTELEALIRGQTPWQSAAGGEITVESMRLWARSFDDDPEATLTGHSRNMRSAMRKAQGEVPRRVSTKPDSPEEIAAFIADVKAGM